MGNGRVGSCSSQTLTVCRPDDPGLFTKIAQTGLVASCFALALSNDSLSAVCCNVQGVRIFGPSSPSSQTNVHL